MQEQDKALIAQAALAYVKPGMTLGLGTGSTTRYFIDAVGKAVDEGLKIEAIATSIETEEQGKRLGIPMRQLRDVGQLDLVIDGIDQIDEQFQVIKGGGGALFREKLVALQAREVLYLADSSKFVRQLTGPLPVEVEPFGQTHVERLLADKGISYTHRKMAEQAFVTDGGHLILDVALDRVPDVAHFVRELKSWSGVIETGYFERQPDHVLTLEHGNIKLLAHPTLRSGGGIV